MLNEKIIFLFVAIAITCFYLLPLDDIQDYFVDLIINEIILNQLKPIGESILQKLSKNIQTIGYLIGLFFVIATLVYIY